MDYVMIRVITRNVELIEQVANPALQRVADWMVEYGLMLVSEKTEAIMFTKKRAYHPPALSVCVYDIKIRRQLRYLTFTWIPGYLSVIA